MADDPKDEPTQQTPKGHTIPVPPREDVERALERIARPVDPKFSRRRLRRPRKQ